MIRALEISASALTAQRTRMDVIAGNIANAFTTRQEDGTIEPYRRRVVSFAPNSPEGRDGVRVDRIRQDPSEFRLQYDPGHADAIREGPLAGWVRFPNVNVSMEYVDAIEAGRSYEANIAMMTVSRSMLERSMDLFA